MRKYIPREFDTCLCPADAIHKKFKTFDFKSKAYFIGAILIDFMHVYY